MFCINVVKLLHYLLELVTDFCFHFINTLIQNMYSDNRNYKKTLNFNF